MKIDPNFQKLIDHSVETAVKKHTKHAVGEALDERKKGWFPPRDIWIGIVAGLFVVALLDSGTVINNLERVADALFPISKQESVEATKKAQE